MELLIGVAGPGAAPGECTDVLVRAQEGATVADLARALAGAGAVAGPVAPDPVVVALGASGKATGAPPAPALWVGDALLDPGVRLEEGVVRDGALVGLEGPAPDVDEPDGVVELRVVGGPGAGCVHRLGLGEYTVGGAGCDVVIPGADRPLVRVRVEAGARVRVEAMEGAADLKAPARPVRARALPGPLVLRRRGAEEAGADVVIGARFAGKGDYSVRGPRWWAMRLLSFILSRVCGTRLTDTTSGFKLSGRRAIELFAREYPAEYLGDTIEALVIAARSNLVVRQVPVAMRPRAGGTPSQNPLKAAKFLGRAFVALGISLTRPTQRK